MASREEREKVAAARETLDSKYRIINSLNKGNSTILVYRILELQSIFEMERCKKKKNPDAADGSKILRPTTQTRRQKKPNFE